MTANGADSTWKQSDGALKTRWAKDVTPANALPKYPRPQMIRKQWMSLNGVWQFAAAKQGDEVPAGKDPAQRVLVPYPIESSLSGVMRHEDPMWDRPTVHGPQKLGRQARPLHLGAGERGSTR